MNILIIGGTGVLSHAVVQEALKQGISVTMINRGRRKNLIPQGVELIKSDKDDKEAIHKALRGRRFDAVMDYLCFTDNETTNSFNFYSRYTKQYFFISSCAVYNTSLGGVFKEDSPKVLSMWNYSVNKWESEKHLIKLASQTDVKYTIIRPSVTYDDTRIPYGISPQYGFHWTLVARVLNGKPIIRWNGGINRCNMMRVEDFAIGVVGLIGNPKAYNEAFNVCGDETPSFNDVLETLSRLTHKEIKTIDIPSAFYAKELPEHAGEILGGRSLDSLNSNEKIKSVVPNFKQTIFLYEGMQMTYQAYINQNYQHGIDWKFEGNTDRVILYWCKKNKIPFKKLNLRFIDYLNNAGWKEKVTYYFAFHKNRFDIRLVKCFVKLARKIKK